MDDLSDESFLEDVSRYDLDPWDTDPEQFASLMRGFCLKKIYPGVEPCIPPNADLSFLQV